MSELSEDPYIAAERLGLTVVLPGENELFIDLDDDASVEHYADMLAVLDENDIQYQTRETTSAGGNTHAYVTLPGPPLSPQLRIALQAARGSDRKRELLSALRIRLHLDRPPTVFFEVPIAENSYQV